MKKTPEAKHIDALIKSGWTTAAIADQAYLNRDTIRRVRAFGQIMSTATSARLMKLKPLPPGA